MVRQELKSLKLSNLAPHHRTPADSSFFEAHVGEVNEAIMGEQQATIAQLADALRRTQT